MITLLVGLIVVCVILWAAQRLMAAFGVGDPISTVVYVLLVLVALWWLLGEFGLVSRMPLR